jgi:hypothetical protein
MRRSSGTTSPTHTAAVNFFIKDVSNFIVGGTQRQTINGVIDPTTGQPAQFSVSQQVNGPDATVRGVELAWQHVFGDSGFGFNANATFVEHQQALRSQGHLPERLCDHRPGQFGQPRGLLSTRTVFEARVAVNWRKEYLLQFGQNQNTGAFGSEPTFENPNLQIDFSTSYAITKQINHVLRSAQPHQRDQSTRGRFDNQLLDVFAYGRRYHGRASASASRVLPPLTWGVESSTFPALFCFENRPWSAPSRTSSSSAAAPPAGSPPASSPPSTARQATGFTVTLVESPNTPIIGVGEGTWPTLRTTLAEDRRVRDRLLPRMRRGLQAGRQVRALDHGRRGRRLLSPADAAPGLRQVNLAPHWLADGRGGQLLRRGLPARPDLRRRASRPRRSPRREYDAVGQLRLPPRRGQVRPVPAAPLHRREAGRAPRPGRCAQRRWLPRTATSRASSPSRQARSRATCSSTAPASASLLLGEALGVPFRDCGDVLFCDTALAVQVPMSARQPDRLAHHLHRPVGRLDLGHRPADPPRHRPCLFEPPHLRRRGRARAARLYRPGRQGPAGTQDPDPLGPSRDLLEAQLRGRRPGRRLPGAARSLGDRADRAVGQADRRADAGLPRSDGHRRHRASTRHPLSLGPDHRLPQAALCAQQAHRHRLLARQPRPETIPERLQDLLLLWRYQPPWFHEEFDRSRRSSRPPAINMCSTAWASAPRSSPRPSPARRAWRRARDARERRCRPSGCARGLPRHRDLIRKIVEHGLQPV